MNDKTVYAKTPAGQQEIGERKAGLDVRQRRLLILVDGQRSVAELRGVSGFPDTLALLEGLQSRGMVASAGGASAAAVAAAASAGRVPATAAATASAPANAGDVRERGRRAAHAITELLGPMGEDFAMKLEGVKSSEALEELLARCRRMLGEMRGKSALERFERLLEES
ncbi:hypothetical protein [Luteimonas kalidii]|uniref:Uncharacterized protein n=1 Tax=Luteimonas kalidii TaxID=3042025 RepID=A0ABT6JTD2_9GAMM|nr:hypothetical protein [Luteimonas kalidii]MDH5833743.1 hypothetical protein [Luteimonas kalidii]